MRESAVCEPLEIGGGTLRSGQTPVLDSPVGPTSKLRNESHHPHHSTKRNYEPPLAGEVLLFFFIRQPTNDR
jgi:hypothetical protein